MSGFLLTFRVDAPAAPGDSTSPVLSHASSELRKRLYPSLGLKARSVAWVTVTLGTAKGDRVVRALAAERAAGRAFVGAATLTETLDRDGTAGAEWFFLQARTVDDFNLWDAYPSCKAGTLPKVHALNHTFVSSAFANLCRTRDLSGVSFLRCASRGRKAGDPWFVALPDHALGRGLDHRWFDRTRWLADVRFRPHRRTSALNIGQTAFHQRWLRDVAMEEAPLRELLTICPAPAAYEPLGGLQIVTVPRFWRGALPDADFAHTPWGEDGPNREGKILRFRNLFVSARARVALVDAKLFEEKSFLPVRIVDEPEAGVSILDSPDYPLRPMYTLEELQALRENERRVVAGQTTAYTTRHPARVRPAARS